ncbi:MAG: hypothetical protein ACPGVD_00325 [Flavobacteriales bacterium]
MKSGTDLQIQKNAILEFVNKTENTSLISKLKEMIDSFRSNEDEDFELPEWQKEIVRERIKNSKFEDMIPLKDLKEHLKF